MLILASFIGSAWAAKMRLLACCYNDPEMQIDPDTVYPIRPDCRDDAPKTRFKPRVWLLIIIIIFPFIFCSPVPCLGSEI